MWKGGQVWREGGGGGHTEVSGGGRSGGVVVGLVGSCSRREGVMVTITSPHNS